MTIADLTEVWTPLNLAAAVAAGLIVGFLLVGRFASDPAYASGVATPISYAVLTGVTAAAIGMIFYGLQILTSYIGGDTEWTRVVSRFALWVFYSASIGIGLWLRLRRHIATKHAEAHDRAVSELAAEE